MEISHSFFILMKYLIPDYLKFCFAELSHKNMLLSSNLRKIYLLINTRNILTLVVSFHEITYLRMNVKCLQATFLLINF